MKLRTRLIVSFLIITLLPISLVIVACAGINHFQLQTVQEELGMEEHNSYKMYLNALVERITDEAYDTLVQVTQNNAELLLDKEYLEEENQELSDKKSFLVVRRNTRIIYNGDSEELDEEQLPVYGNDNSNTVNGFYLEDDSEHLLKQIDFTFQDGSEGSVFIVTEAKSILPKYKSVVTNGIICVILILFLTAGLLIMWIYTGIIHPIKKLQEAAENIKEGNLDFVIEVEGQDEISKLMKDFEEMRQRLKESAEEKIQNDKENKVLISNISHDLKTPITAIKGYVEGIIDGVADTPEKQEKYLRTVYNKANEMNRLINELTIYSQIDNSRIPYNYQKINVGEFFQDCMEEISLDLEAKNIGLTYFNYVNEQVLIIADPEQLKRVINNIIGNAVKYKDCTKPKALINLRIKDVGDFIQVEIEDNGRGIASKDLPFIFDRFYRADASRNSAQGGSGIGLSIVKKIIEDHDGKIWATSKESIGTVMYFVIRKYQEVPNE